MTELQQAIIAAAESLEVGEVVSFGDLAAKAGKPKASRAAGSVMSKSGDTVPWWRVVYSDGHLPPCNPSLQNERLEEEGVQLKGFRVVKSSKGRFAK